MTCKRILLGLALLLAVAGVASAQTPCPECDEDGPDNMNNSYHSVDVGAVENHTESLALVDTDAAHSHELPSDGFWAWLSVCLNAFIGAIEETLGMDTGVAGNADAFLSEEGADVDATLYVAGERVDFDDSPIGGLDGETWNASAELRTVTGELPDQDLPRIPEYEGLDVDACVYGDVRVVGC